MDEPTPEHQSEPPLFTEVLPTLAAHLKPSLIREGEEALAATVDSLRVHALCSCGDSLCMTFYAVPKSRCDGSYRVVMPDTVLTIGVCDDAISSIEDDYHYGGADPDKRLAEFVKLRTRVTARRA